MSGCSESVSALLKALVSFQAEAPFIPLDSVNPHYGSKFASLAGVADAIRQKLAAHGLAVSQMPTAMEDGTPALTTTLFHESGEWMTDTMPLLVERATMQGLGSALTYARRYALLGMLGLVGDEDGDGEAAERRVEGGVGDVKVPKSWVKLQELVEKSSGDPQVWDRFHAFIRACSYSQFGKADEAELTADQRRGPLFQKCAGAAVWCAENPNTPLGPSWSVEHIRQGFAHVLDGALLEVPDLPAPELEGQTAIDDEIERLADEAIAGPPE